MSVPRAGTVRRSSDSTATSRAEPVPRAGASCTGSARGGGRICPCLTGGRRHSLRVTPCWRVPHLLQLPQDTARRPSLFPIGAENRPAGR